MLWLSAVLATVVAVGCGTDPSKNHPPDAAAADAVSDTDTQAGDADAQGTDAGDTLAADGDVQAADAADVQVADADAQTVDADAQVADADAQADGDTLVSDGNAQIGDGDAVSVDATADVAAALTITITNFAYAPVNLTVPAGAVVTVLNKDTVLHSVTSQATAGAFVPGAVAGVSFDSGVIAAGATGQFTVPLSAVSGTVVPYFCTVHPGTMANTAQITVQ
jgi:plastocyanin